MKAALLARVSWFGMLLGLFLAHRDMFSCGGHHDPYEPPADATPPADARPTDARPADASPPDVWNFFGGRRELRPV